MRYAHGCDDDYEQEKIEADEMAAQLIDHENGECGGVRKNCPWCEANQDELDKADEAKL